MKRPFWVKGSTPWDTFKINFKLVCSIIANASLSILILLCLFGILYIVFYKIPTTIVNIGNKEKVVSDKLKAEEDDCFKMEYAGKKFYKFNLEGHEYWCVENFKNNVGFCHSESCSCKTNKTEVHHGHQ